MVELSTLTKQHVTALFGSSDWAEAERLLASECGENLPLVNSPTPSGLERLRFAAIRVSGGSLPRLRDAIELAKSDWRDLLVASYCRSCATWGSSDPNMAISRSTGMPKMAASRAASSGRSRYIGLPG